MRVGDYDVEVTSGRITGGWVSTGVLPDGKKVTSAPKSSREDAEHDVKQQATARLYPNRRYDVNRPFESMKSRKFKHLSPADEAIVMHKADRLIEAVTQPYEIGPEGEEVHRPECPNCGGPGDAIDVDQCICMNCDSVFPMDSKSDSALLGRISKRGPLPPKASFYPSGGASGGAGVSSI
jgi:hypothetical protein